MNKTLLMKTLSRDLQELTTLCRNSRNKEDGFFHSMEVKLCKF